MEIPSSYTPLPPGSSSSVVGMSEGYQEFKSSQEEDVGGSEKSVILLPWPNVYNTFMYASMRVSFGGKCPPWE